MTAVMTLEQLVDKLEKSTDRLDGTDLLMAYYGEDGYDFSDYSSGNFDDDVDLGVRLGTFETECEILNILKSILEAQQ